MARKYDFISELYNRTCKTVVANPASWEAFLRSACYNYRLRFDEQLLVHAQRPDATAVLQIDDWNQKFGRWVNRGAHGIAVFEDADQRRQRLVHYFDISDTHPSRFSRRVPIWQMRDEYTAEVIDTLESTFGELNDKETLAVAIESAARNAVEDNIPDYLPDLLYSVKDSFLDGVSEEEITHIFKTAVRNSVAYMTMTRLGIEAGEYFEPDDLRDVVNFTTPATLNALGYATSDIAEMGLAEISRTILALDRQNRIIAEKTKADYNVFANKTIPFSLSTAPGVPTPATEISLIVKFALSKNLLQASTILPTMFFGESGKSVGILAFETMLYASSTTPTAIFVPPKIYT